ncbi:MAG: flagellar assembly protein FliW [Negativicutes bacterium]|nr:flagellar assembly protein FliW [Negativicutes bacterium]MDR3589767.1 flagellar assembly protein FliW [Negativicutes bacterium]
MVVDAVCTSSQERTEGEMITFPQGLIGLEEYQKFVLKQVSEESLFQILQSKDEKGFELLVTSPFWVAPDYSFELPDIYSAQLGDAQGIEVLVTVTLASDPKDCTVNLLGPLVINRKSGKGFQVLASDKVYTTKHKICQSAGGK